MDFYKPFKAPIVLGLISIATSPILWIGPILLLWQGSFFSSAVWVGFSIWLILFLYIFEKLALNHFGSANLNIFTILFNFFRNSTALTCSFLIILAYSLILVALAIFFNWLIDYLNLFSDPNLIVYSVYGFIFLIFFAHLKFQKIIRITDIFEVIGLIIVTLIVISGIFIALEAKSYRSLNSFYETDIVFFFGLVFMSFASPIVWLDTGSTPSRRSEFKNRFLIISLIAAIAIVSFFGLPQLMSQSDEFLKINFLPYYFSKIIPEIWQTPLIIFISIQIFASGIKISTKLNSMITSIINLDYETRGSRSYNHLKNKKFISYAIEFLILFVVGSLIAFKWWDIYSLIKVAAYLFLAMAIILSLINLYLSKKPTEIYLALFFLIINIMITAFFGWLLLIPFIIIVTACVIDLENFIKNNNSNKNWLSQLKHVLRR